jgi:uncharacterized protein with HEPN domain
MKYPKPYLINILQSIDAIESYIPKDFESFSKDDLRQDAILMRLQDIGENLIHLRDIFPKFWDEYENDEWNQAIGLRNIISHGYAKVKIEIVWQLIKNDLPSFKESIKVLV